MMNQQYFIFVVAVVASLGGSLAVRNGTRSGFKPHSTKVDSLARLGDITTRLVTTLVEAEDEQVDIYGMANLVTALSKAATAVEHPEMYQDLIDTGLEEQLTTLSSTVKHLTAEQKSLQQTIRTQEDQLDLLDEMAHQLNQSKAVITQLEQKIKEQETFSGSQVVGFTAWADNSDYYSSGAIIKFPQLAFNYGSAYDPLSGQFTCPFSGIYSVSTHLEERNNGGLQVKVMLDNDVLFKLHIHDDGTDHHNAAGSAMVGCLHGQDIYVVTQDSGSSAEVQNIEKRSIFSVYLIKRMSDEDVIHGNSMES